MNRRSFLTQSASALLAASTRAQTLTRPSGAAPAQVSRERKNVLLIIMEQFQHNVASYAGGPAMTPNLEKFARKAINFKTACTTTGLCSPSRAALFTGRLGQYTSFEDNPYGWHTQTVGLDLKHTTLIEWARRRDYFTGYFGKCHLGPDAPIRRGVSRYLAKGFERPATPGKTEKPDFLSAKRYYEKGQTFLEKPGYYATAKGSYEASETHEIAQAGVEFLQESGRMDQPFFLTLGFLAVHPSYNVPKPYSEMYDWRSVKLPINLHDSFERKPAYQTDILWPWMDTGHMSDDDWRRSNAFYYGYVSMLDRALGEVFNALQSNGLAESTLVVVMADHGDMNGAHHLFDKGPHCYDELMRIPLLIHWPGAPEREVTRHVVGMDVNATIVEWAGLQPDTATNSRSLRPLIEHGDAGWNSPDESFYRYELYNGHWFGVRAIRTPDHKYCFNPSDIYDELYDLRNDPGELVNLIDTTGMTLRGSACEPSGCKNVVASKATSVSAQYRLEDRLLAYLESTDDTLVASRLRLHLTATRSKRKAEQSQTARL
jgi:arylsulfatase A-like enzyme